MRQRLAFFFSMVLASTCFGAPQHYPKEKKSRPAKLTVSRLPLDQTGAVRRGKASYYGKEFYGRTMADGTQMNPNSNVAASRTLPLGTKAEVKNLDNGKSETVEIKDRGPFIEGRIIDLSPKTADRLGMLERGVVPVEVRPIEVPQADGSLKRGVVEAEENPHLLTSGE